MSLPSPFYPLFYVHTLIQHKVGVFNLKRSKMLLETPQTTANHLLYRGSKIGYQIRSDADLKFMITFNGIIIFFPVRSITDAQCSKMKFVKEEHYTQASFDLYGCRRRQWNRAIGVCTNMFVLWHICRRIDLDRISNPVKRVYHNRRNMLEYL